MRIVQLTHGIAGTQVSPRVKDRTETNPAGIRERKRIERRKKVIWWTSAGAESKLLKGEKREGEFATTRHPN
jgi:hypothetical protein